MQVILDAIESADLPYGVIATIGKYDGIHRGQQTVLRRVVACTALVHLLYGAALLVEPLYVRDVLGRSEEVFAGLQAIFGVASRQLSSTADAK